MTKQIRTIEMTNAQRSVLSYLSEVEESVTDLIRFANMWSSEVVARRSLTVQCNYRARKPALRYSTKLGRVVRRQSPKGPEEKSSTFHERR